MLLFSGMVIPPQQRRKKRKGDEISSMAPPLKIIFLDIDGVILPFPRNNNNRPDGKSNRLFPEDNINALKRLLNLTGAQLVLSSSWRSQSSFVKDILSDFKKHDMGIDRFYDMTDIHHHSERQWEIHRWLEKKRKERRVYWLAVDDEHLIEGKKNEKFRSIFQGHTIRTISSVGLVEKDVDDGILLWKAQSF